MYSYLKTGAILAAVHSVFAVVIYFAVKNSAGVAQAEFAWFLLFFLDFPVVIPAYDIIGSWLSGIDKNTVALIIVGVFGGLQWFVLGTIGHLGIRTLALKLKSRQKTVS